MCPSTVMELERRIKQLRLASLLYSMVGEYENAARAKTQADYFESVLSFGRVNQG